MLKLDAVSLSEEIDRANKFRLTHTKPLKKLIERYVGRWYSDDLRADPTPENHMFAYVAHMMTELAYAAPSPRVKATWKSVYREVAEAMETALGAWTAGSSLSGEIALLVRDALLGWGILKVGMESAQPVFSGTETSPAQSLQPFAVRIPPDQFGMDPRCEHWREARFLYHEYWKDLDDLQNARGADPEVVKSLTSSYESTPQKGDERALRQGETADRNQVKLVDIWIPESGKICTLASSNGVTGMKFLRPPTDWWGPSKGPFIVLGLYAMPGDPYPCGPFQPIMGQIEELNAHIVAAAEEAATLKSFVLVDASNTDAAEAVKGAGNGDVIPIRNMGKDILPITLGGTSPQRMEHINALRERVDRMLSFSDAQRGLADAGQTATQSQIVQSNVDTRTEWMRSQVNFACITMYINVGWYCFYDPNYIQKVSHPRQQQNPQTGAMETVSTDGYFLGGIFHGQEKLNWETDFTVSIEPNSMQRTDDKVVQARAMQVIQMMTNVGKVMPSMPWWDWKYAVNGMGESFNQKDLWELIFNPAFAPQFQQQPQNFAGDQSQIALPEGFNQPLMGGYLTQAGATAGAAAATPGDPNAQQASQMQQGGVPTWPQPQPPPQGPPPAQPAQPPPPRQQETLNFKDLPPDAQARMLQMLGLAQQQGQQPPAGQ